jgi:hypothetical protein
MNIKLLPLLVFTATLAFLTPAANASVILGEETQALIGGDLTDPENDGFVNSYVNYNATFRSSVKSGFGGREKAFNVFDNTLTGGNGKWCCNGGDVWVEADFGTDRYILDMFTLSSANDRSNRDSDQWRILGSNDGINYTALYSYDEAGQSIWNKRLQVVQFSNNNDYNITTAYSIFRYQSTSVVAGSQHQLGEIEFFGTKIPEPSTIAIFALSLIGLASRQLKK